MYMYRVLLASTGTCRVSREYSHKFPIKVKQTLMKTFCFRDAHFERSNGQISSSCVKENLVRLKNFIGKTSYPGKTKLRFWIIYLLFVLKSCPTSVKAFQ